MNHSFIASKLDITICTVCKKSESDHTSDSHCEACDYSGPKCDIFQTMIMCPDCIEKEKTSSAEIEQTADTRVEVMEEQSKLAHAKEIDYSIEVRSDLFNAATVAITELEKAIQEDTTIENKRFALAEAVADRVKHFQSTLFDLDEKRLQIANEKYRFQVYLNDLAGKLRQEERDKLKLQDLNYKPITPVIKKPKAPSKVKFDKVELRKFAAELGVSEFMLQMIVVSKNLSVADAAKQIKENLEKAKAQSNQ